MTLFEVLGKAQSELCDTTQDYKFDAWELFSHCFEMSRSEYILNMKNEAENEKTQKLFELVEQRKSGRPLQYIIGKWSFLDYEFFVEEGVLIPRADTECLVEKAAEMIKKNDLKTVYDICSGTGCIGISLAKMFDELQVVLFEKSDEALKCLEKNVSLNGVDNVKIVRGDIFDGAQKYALNSCDMIVSNPPYIRSGEIDSLQREVRFEPRMALDGGEDGLAFYRALKEKWFDKIKRCRFILMECAEDQADEVRSIFGDYENAGFVMDLNNIRRDVCVCKNGE